MPGGKPTNSSASPDREALLHDWLFGPIEPGTPTEAVSDDHLSIVDLPHNAADLSWKDWDPASWERLWLYRKHFPAPQKPQRRHYLRFEGALTTSTPTLNGHRLETHAGGYSPFQYEITEHLRPENILDVIVDGRFASEVPPNWANKPSTAVDFWQPAGLYREVHLVSVPSNHVTDVFAKPVNVLDEHRAVEVHCEVDIGLPGRELRLEAELGRSGTVIAATSTGLSGLPVGRHQVSLHLDGLPDVELWSPASPNLYDVTVTLSESYSERANPNHHYRVRTGFREARFDKTGFYLNGERFGLFGLSRHQIYPFEGHAMPPRVQRRDAEILATELNCNIIRCSTYPHHESFLDACDELGVLVWDEPPGWQFLGEGQWMENSYRDVRDMILRDRNHPCVVLWAARLNETRDHTEFYSRTQQLAKSLDDSRQTTGAMLAADHNTPNFQQDVFSYNDYASSTGPDGAQQPELLAPRDDLPYLVSEAVGTLSGPAKFYRRTDPQTVQQGQALAHARVHSLAGANPAYTGVIGWVGLDYQSGNGNVDRGIKWPGVIDIFRVPKPGAAAYRAQVHPGRRVVVAPSFYWDFHPSSPVTELGRRAAIWSNVDRLELFIDGQHHQSLLPAHAEFPYLAYPPFFADFSRTNGTDLRIEAILGEQRVLTRHFCADRTQDRLIMSADDDTLVAGGSDATRVEFRAVDRHGADRPYVEGDVTLELDGPARLVGDTVFPLGETGGVGAVWVRSGRATGLAQLHAHHPTLGSADVVITVIRE